jgi:MoaA/NifB/PqqE/SkfB family radical SAM enzyme
MVAKTKNLLLVHAINFLFIALAHVRNDKVFRWIYTAMAYMAAKLVKKDYYVANIHWIIHLFNNGHPSLHVTKKILQGTNANQRKILIKAAVINQLLIGTNKRKDFCEQHGFYPPGFFVISPSMKCNLKCVGCYAGYYNKSAELTFDEIDDVLNQAKKMGIYFCVVSGGEPLFHPRIFDIFKKHNDMIFHMYTNGTLIDKDICRKLTEVGNVLPAISIEGYREDTDARRGPGHFDRIMKAMDLLKEAKILFGFSATLTRDNTEILNSDEFIDFMIAKGCILGWYFMYVPIGSEPNLELMQTPEQRGDQIERLARLRSTQPILLADFWNDGPVVGGCISGGRKYFHVNANGDIEPCVFCHFATHNIRSASLEEALRSPLFTSIQCQLPSYENLLRPCIIVDKPDISRNLIDKYHPYFTHDGADIIYNDLADQIDEYAEQYGAVADALWKKLFAEKRG